MREKRKAFKKAAVHGPPLFCSKLVNLDTKGISQSDFSRNIAIQLEYRLDQKTGKGYLTIL